MDEEHVLTVQGRYDQIRTICDFVTEGGRAAGLNADTIFHLELCCDEASTNIIEHAYGAEDVGDITVRYRITDDAFTIILLDHGRPFDPNSTAQPATLNNKSLSPESALTDFLDNIQVGGLGIHFMRNLMDEVHYSFNNEKGNTLTLVKYIRGRSEQ